MTPKEKRKWVAVTVKVDRDAAEAVEAAFNELDALGTSIDLLKTGDPKYLEVKGFFDKSPDISRLEGVIASSLINYGYPPSAARALEFNSVEETDWLAEWKRYWNPTEIGKFIIAPPWSEMGETSKIVIRIEPNMAFGTGTHGTTQLCLKAIGELYSPGISFLDVGTGTGILAIGAAKLGATDIFACDTDADAVAIARENAALNGVAEHIEFSDDRIDLETAQYDFVCGNLTVDVIVPILGLLLDKSKKLLLLSGILGEQESIIRDALLKFQISDIKIETSGDWISVMVER